MSPELPPPVEVWLRGERARVRPIGPDDAERLADGLSNMSARSRQQRFLVALDRLTRKQLEYLTQIDYVDHLALGVELLPEGGEPVGVGVARQVRLAEAEDLAEVAIAIADDWQGEGVGALLMRHLAAWAWRTGIRRWLAVVLVDNHAMLRLMEHVSDPVENRGTTAGVTERVYALRPPGPMVIHWLVVDEAEIVVGATDRRRWESDLAEGASGVDAKTLVYARLVEHGPRRAVAEHVELHVAREDPLRAAALAAIPGLLEAAWTIRGRAWTQSEARLRLTGRSA